MRIEWRNKAYKDALDIVDYIDIENPLAAFAVYEEIHKQISLLSSNPHIGRPGRISGTRELIINRTPYIAAYFVTQNAIVILRVLHGAQRWPKKLVSV
ncbi:MAG: type II toxin-antitoxin system RelE/ParE family toxin [Legionellaceae bacterium]|nr:type II toxin-antitoxin system RelE/ParE family toxin [Legionellaceae bacterium]